MIILLVDEDVPIVPLLDSLGAIGLSMSNIDGSTFHVHPIGSRATVIDLAARRRQQRKTDLESPGPGAA